MQFDERRPPARSPDPDQISHDERYSAVFRAHLPSAYLYLTLHTPLRPPARAFSCIPGVTGTSLRLAPRHEFFIECLWAEHA